MMVEFRGPGAFRAACWYGSGSCLLVLLLLTSGCKPATEVVEPAKKANVSQTQQAVNETPRAASEPAPNTAAPEQVLREMIAAYRRAEAYTDEATVRVSYRVGKQPFEDTAPLAVAFQRPNRLRLEAYRATVVSNGETLFAKIDDESTGNIDAQVVVRPAPAQLHLQDIYGDSLLSQVIGSGLARFPVQLELLLDDRPLAAPLGDQAQRQMLPAAEIEGQPCHRVQVTTAEGAFVFWVDQKSHLLRRLEYPTRQLEPEVAVEQQVEDLQLAVHFHSAQFATPQAADHYAFTIPADATEVRYFVPPPQPLPTTLFGQQPAAFAFKTLGGETVDAASLQGKTAVLLWFNNHPAGEASLKALDRVAEQLQNNDSLVFYGVCTEPQSVSNLQLENLMRMWRVKLPIVRDLSATGRDVFAVPVWPTLVVLDAKGRVQLFEAGHIEAVYEALGEVLAQIAAGEDIAQHILAAHKTELDQYKQELAAASGAADVTMIELGKVEIAPSAEPGHHQLETVWTNTEIAEPGNLLVVPGQGEAEESRLIVLSENRKVCVLDLSGKLLSQHELELPEGAAVQHIVSATDAAGNRIHLVWANLGRQAFLLNDKWQLLASYPALEQEHEGIRDCLLAELRGDGTLSSYLAFWGAAGVHEVSLEGKRQWTNRAATAPLSLAAGPRNAAGHRQLLIATAAGDLLPLNPFGREEAPLTIGSYAIHSLIRAANESMVTPFCATSLAADGTARAIALDADFVERWSYELPPGAHANAIRPITAGTVLPESQGDWIFAGPDGSVHLIAADGSNSDIFYFGQRLTGLAATGGEANLLLLATEKSVSAVRLLPQQ